MNLDPMYDSDSRKKQRRIRTTQSCLNCHTAKRKCDRGRPCSRCMQLGMTGLCVYETDHLNARDDPNMDELTRYRNRVAELEAVIRELRGRPHPRWADPDGRRVSRFVSGSRSDWCEDLTTMSESSSDSTDGTPHGFIKVEEGVDPALTIGPLLSRYSSSHGYSHGLSDGSPVSPGSLSSIPGSPFTDTSSSISSSSHSTHSRHLSNQDTASTCACPGKATAVLESLSQELERTMAVLIPEHNNSDACQLFRRVSELRDALTSLTPLVTTTYPYTYDPHVHATTSESSLANALQIPASRTRPYPPPIPQPEQQQTVHLSHLHQLQSAPADYGLYQNGHYVTPTQQTYHPTARFAYHA